MIKKSVLSILLVSLTSQTFAAGWQPPTSVPSEAKIDRRLLSIQRDSLSSAQRETLIQQNIDTKKKVSPPSLDIGTEKRQLKNFFQEGTGTRGGGSGVWKQGTRSEKKLILMDLYRSQYRSIYQEFFETDPELIQISLQNPPEVAAEMIFQKVLQRMGGVAPGFAQKIQNIAREMPFSRWTPSISALPLLDDHLEIAEDPIKDRVQIAYRRANQVIYDETLYQALDGLNRAALWLHEYLYALSGHITSLQTQRAVSLFMSSDFEQIAARDQQRLTLLFWELGILNISRKTVQVPPGAQIIDPSERLPEVCGIMQKIRADAATRTAVVDVTINSELKSFPLSTLQLMVFGNAMLQVKDALNKKFAIYKYPAQAIALDVVCASTETGKISSLEVALIYDPRLQEADLENAKLEAQYYQAQRNYVIAKANSSDENAVSEKLQVFQNVEAQLSQSKIKLESLNSSLSAATQILEQKQLGQYKVRFDF